MTGRSGESSKRQELGCHSPGICRAQNKKSLRQFCQGDSLTTISASYVLGGVAGPDSRAEPLTHM